MTSPPVTLFNPLPVTLGHYGREVQATLGRLGIETVDAIPSPATDADVPRAKRAVAHVKEVRGRSTTPRVLVLWPAFGWLEVPLWIARSSQAALLLHDPVPIREQLGYGPRARGLAGFLRQRAGHRTPRIVCHTQAAADAARTSAPRIAPDPLVCSHPILTAAADSEAVAAPAGGRVLVAGQFKPSRDVELLAELGPGLRERGFEPRIVGRGWRQIPGWTVRDAFVTEAELDLELAAAAVVVIPYKQYWQSGIAIRAVELNRPVVGEQHPFLSDLLGQDAPGLVETGRPAEAWQQSIERSAAAASGVLQARIDYQQRTDSSWSAVFGELWGP